MAYGARLESVLGYSPSRVRIPHPPLVISSPLTVAGLSLCAQMLQKSARSSSQLSWSTWEKHICSALIVGVPGTLVQRVVLARNCAGVVGQDAVHQVGEVVDEAGILHVASLSQEVKVVGVGEGLDELQLHLEPQLGLLVTLRARAVARVVDVDRWL